MLKNKIKKAAAAVAAVAVAGALTIGTGVADAQAYAGDWLYLSSNSNTGMSVLLAGKWYWVSPGHSSPNNLDGFYVVSGCYARNNNTGYKYYGGYHSFAWGNAFLSLQNVC